MTTPVLLLSGISKVFGRDDAAVRALDDIDLEMDAGEIVVVTGPSGSGKTTLLQVAGGLVTPTDGTVSIQGTRLDRLSNRRLAHLRAERVGFVFQSFNLFSSLSAEANVRLPLSLVPRDRRGERVTRLLSDLGLEDRAAHRPGELSGGQQQRVAIARALVNDPDLILADEPTGNLDSHSGFTVLHQLERLSRGSGKALLVVTHDHRITQVADRVLWLEDGRWGSPSSDRGTMIDVVCGMAVPANRAAGTRTFAGQTLYFCSDICLAKFDAAPRSYASAGARRQIHGT